MAPSSAGRFFSIHASSCPRNAAVRSRSASTQRASARSARPICARAMAEGASFVRARELLQGLGVLVLPPQVDAPPHVLLGLGAAAGGARSARATAERTSGDSATHARTRCTSARHGTSSSGAPLSPIVGSVSRGARAGGAGAASDRARTGRFPAATLTAGVAAPGEGGRTSCSEVTVVAAGTARTGAGARGRAPPHAAPGLPPPARGVDRSERGGASPSQRPPPRELARARPARRKRGDPAGIRGAQSRSRRGSCSSSA